MNEKNVPCIACGAKLRKMWFDDKPPKIDNWHAVIGGIICRSRGNYGSTVCDMEGQEYLEFYLCDECLKRKAKIVDRCVTGEFSEPFSKTLAGQAREAKIYIEQEKKVAELRAKLLVKKLSDYIPDVPSDSNPK